MSLHRERSGLPPASRPPSRKDKAILWLGGICIPLNIVGYLDETSPAYTVIRVVLLVFMVPSFIYEWQSYWKRKDEWDRWKKRAHIHDEDPPNLDGMA